MVTNDTSAAAALRERFLRTLQTEVRSVVDRVVETATTDAPVFVVGGVVRDLLLGTMISSVDVDIVTLSDAIEIARRAAGELRVTAYDRFRTASIEVGGRRVDLATARRETYTSPGALPQVETAGIEQDLLRRDFTMNALALTLSGDPAILDPAHGRRDIESRVVRVLHDRSFEDDATRIFRAFRYVARLDFTIEPHTMSLIRAGIPFIEKISGERLRHELTLMFDEESGARALEGIGSAGALAAIHSALRWSSRKTSAMHSSHREYRSARGWCLIASEARSDEADEIALRLHLTQSERDAVRAMPALNAAAAVLRRSDMKPSGAVTVLERLPVEAIEMFVALTDDTALRGLLQRYLDEWRLERPLLSGHDLIAMGVPEGPRIGQALQLIRAARLDGWASDRDDERAIAMRFAKSIRDSRAMNQPLDFTVYDN